MVSVVLADGRIDIDDDSVERTSGPIVFSKLDGARGDATVSV